MRTVALFGAHGFVGSEVYKEFQKADLQVFDVTRATFQDFFGRSFDYVINAAMPSARFKAKNEPSWDFVESVEKTAKIFYGIKFKKFVHISSISARSQLDTVYGRHKAAAEAIVNDGNSLIVRLGPMFGESLKKGVLIDMIEGKRVFVDGESRYAFAPLSFVAQWLVKNCDRQGVIEVGARNSVSLADLAKTLNLKAEFEGTVDHQEVTNAQGDFPDVNLVLDFMKERQK